MVQPPIRVRPRVRDVDRKRAVQACWRCRNRKSRCIVTQTAGARTFCQRCLKDKARCIFGNYQPSSSVRGAETTSNNEGSVIQDKSSVLLSTTESTPPDSSASVASSESLDSVTKRKHTQEHLKGQHQVAQLVVKNPHQTHFIGGISNGTFVSEVQDAVAANSPGFVKKDRGISSDFIHLLDSNITDQELLIAALAGFPPRSVADSLVSIFFHIVEANYYYMDRKAFKERLEKCYDGLSPESVDFDAGFVCLALMVFAMGSQFADLRAPAENTPSTPMSIYGPGTVFYLKTKPLLSDVIMRCSLESIQVCFLMGLFLLPTNTSDLSYVYHGMALKLAISAGLHRKVGNSNLSSTVLHVRNRLWWSLYTSERRLTIILGRPESIREEDIDTPLPEICEELDLPQTGANLIHLQASIKLTEIYNRTVRIGQTLDFAAEDSQAEVMRIRYDLEQWLGHLPNRLQLGNMRPESKSFRGAVHLHMTYNQVIIYMGREAVLRRMQRLLHSQTASVSAKGSEILDRPNLTLEEARAHDCVAAAYKIVDLIRFLFSCKKLARFSFTDINCCCTAAIIIIIHEIIQPHPLYESSLSWILQCMKHMATGCQNAKHGHQLVENLLVLVTAVVKGKPTSTPNGSIREEDSPTEGQIEFGYQEWETWMFQAESSTLGQQTGPQEPSSLFAEPINHAQGTLTSGPETGELTYNWPEDLNFLGLSAFEGLEFPPATIENLFLAPNT